MPSSRPSRILAMLLFVSVLTSLLPHAAAAAPTPFTSPIRTAPSVPTVLDEPPPGHRPAPATSAVTPVDFADIVNRAIEETHQAQFDGTFSGSPQREVFRYPGSVTVAIPDNAESASVILPVLIPAYAHDSFQVDVQTIPSQDNSVYLASDASIEIKPVTGTVWIDSDLLGGKDSLPNPTPLTPMWRTLAVNYDPLELDIANKRIPPDVPIQLRLVCTTNTNGDGGSCTFGNFRFYDDAPGWSRRDLGDRQPSTWTGHIGIVNDGGEGSEGPFFLVDIPSGSQTGIGPANGVQYRSGHLRMPPLQAGDILTGTLRWAEDYVAPSQPLHPRKEIRIVFLRDSDNGAAPVTLAKVPERPNTTPSSGWKLNSTTILDGSSPSSAIAAISKQRGTFAIHIETNAAAPMFVGIDSFKLYLNGQELAWSNRDDQAYNCKCTKTASGEYQLVIGDPVNTLSGVLIESATDAVIATASTPLSMQRTYVSSLADPTTVPQSPLGFGWRFNYGETLTLPTASVGAEPHTIIYESAEGNRYRFRDYGSGEYQAAPGIRAALSAVSGGYRITFPDQSWRAFDSAGRLIQLADSAGRTQTITIGMNGVSNSVPTQVVDDLSGRKLSFSYMWLDGTNRRLQTVTDDLNQVTTYGYDAAGHLTWVTSPQGTITRYETNSLHQIIGIAKGLTSYDTTANRRDLVMTYTDGKVTQQVERDGRTWQYAYTTTANGEPQTTITIRRNGAILDTQIAHYRADRTLRWIERNNTFSHYQTTDANLAPAATVSGNGYINRLWAAPSGLPLRKEAGFITATGSSFSGSPLIYTYNTLAQPTSLTYPTGQQFTAQYDGLNRQVSFQEGSLTPMTVTYYGTTRAIDTITLPHGSTTHYTYTPAGQPHVVEKGSSSGIVQTTAYTYDALGRVTDITTGYGTAMAITTHTEYRPDNQIGKVIHNYKNGGTPSTATDNVVTEYGYDGAGRQIWVKGSDGRYRNVTSYDSAGRVRWVVDNALNSSGIPTIPSVSGNPPAFNPSYPSGNVATLYGYDWLGRTTLMTQTGILTGTFNPSTLLWSGSTTRVTRTEYDVLSRPITITLNYRPDINGGQFSSQYADVNVQTYTYYDGSGNITWTRDALRRWTRFEYDALNRPVTTTLNYENGNPLTLDPANSAWASLTDTDIIQVKRYNQAGNVVEVIENYVDGIQDTSVPNTAYPWQVTDVITDRRSIDSVDSLGRVTQTIENYAPTTTSPDFNRTTGTIYTSTGQTQATYDVMGQYTVPQYDALGHVIQSIDNCRSSTGTPQSTGCGTQTSDRNVATATTHYDVFGRVDDVLETNGTHTKTDYDNLGRVIKVTKNYQAPPVGVSATINVASTTTYADAAGITVTTTDPTGKATTTTRNLDTGVTTVTAPSGLITRSGPRWSKTPDGQVTVSLIDGLGRTIQTVSNYQDGMLTGADGTTRDLISRTRYDGADRMVVSIDSLGIVTRYRYDLRDNLIQVVENADGTCSQVEASDCQLTTQYRYDRVGNQIAVINGRGIVSRIMRYDTLDRLRQQEDALGNLITTTYTVRGAVASVQPSGGTAITTSYDELGRQISKTGASGASQNWSYDSAGRLATAFDASAQNTATGKTGVLTYNYDALNRVSGVQQSLADDPTAGAWTLGYGYDAAGRVTLIGGNSYGYDSAGRLQTIGRGGFTIAQYGYNSTTGWVETLTRSEAGTSRAVETTLYDTLGRVSSITVNGATGTGATPTAQLAQFSYTYDRASRPVTFSEVQLNSSGTTVTENHSYTYDNLGRLASETAGSTTTGYGYDRAGNRVRVGGTNLSYLNNDRRSGWTYDVYGNVLNNGIQSYSYDGFNRPTTVTIGANSYTYRYHDESLVSKRTNGTLSNAFVTDRVGTPYSSLLRISTFVGSDQYDTTYVSGVGGTILQVVCQEVCKIRLARHTNFAKLKRSNDRIKEQ